MSLFGGRMTPDLRRALTLRSYVRSAFDVSAFILPPRRIEIENALRQAIDLIDELIAELERKEIGP